MHSMVYNPFNVNASNAFVTADTKIKGIKIWNIMIEKQSGQMEKIKNNQRAITPKKNQWVVHDKNMPNEALYFRFVHSFIKIEVTVAEKQSRQILSTAS